MKYWNTWKILKALHTFFQFSFLLFLFPTIKNHISVTNVLSFFFFTSSLLYFKSSYSYLNNINLLVIFSLLFSSFFPFFNESLTVKQPICSLFFFSFSVLQVLLCQKPNILTFILFFLSFFSSPDKGHVSFCHG